MKIHMMLAHNLMACYVTTLTGLRKKKQKKKTNDITSKGKPPWLAYSQAKPYPE